MTWLTEDPLLLWLAGAVVVTLLLVVYLQTRANWALFTVLGVLLLVLVLTLVEHFVVTPREAVANALREVLAAVEADDLLRTLDLISPSAVEVRADAETLMPRLDILRARATDTPVISLQGESAATAKFRGFVDVTDKRSGVKGGYFDDLTVKFSRENGRWLVTGYEATDKWRERAGAR